MKAVTMSGKTSEGIPNENENAMANALAVCPDGNEYTHAGGWVTFAIEMDL